VLWIAMCIGFIWGNLAEKSYNWRMKWFKWSMLGKLAEKEYFIKWTKRIVYFALSFGVIVYILIMLIILNR
jgi:hypothetical protein